MRNLIFLFVLFLSMPWLQTAHAMQIDASFFDPADPTQVEGYTQMVSDLEQELTIVATDDNDDELFRVMAVPLELVFLRAQLAIDKLGSNDPAGLAPIIAQANHDKPTDNSFQVVITGKPEWIGRQVDLYYYLNEDNPVGVKVPAINAGEIKTLGDGTAQATWTITFQPMSQLEDLRIAPIATIVVGEGEEAVKPVTLDCGFWREYQLFDLNPNEAE